jgi:CubicO group peptidase (beta-lactamase class C family)
MTAAPRRDGSGDVASMVSGTVDPEFEEVRLEFIRNFAERDEFGAACSVYQRGRKVVDLWGGSRNASGEPWAEDTLVMVFSATKGLSAMAMAVAHSQSLLRYEEPVATYWPEFAQNGKQDITVHQLLSHQAGLTVIDQLFDATRLADPDFVAQALARQKPAWEAGTHHGYHAFSLGQYESELIRRTDPQRRTLGRYFHDEIATPLGLEFYIGLPADIPSSRIAKIQPWHMLRLLAAVNSLPRGMLLAMLWPRSLTARTFRGNLKVRSPADFDSPDFRRIEHPAVNGIGTVRSIAKAYGVFATGGRELNIRPESLAALTAPAAAPSRGRKDQILHADVSYSHGFCKPSQVFRFGSSERAFGMPGVGGSFAYADPDLELGYAYAPNRLGYRFFDDPREKALRDAVHRSATRRVGPV